MARTREGAQLTSAHRQGQLRIRAQALRDFTRLWPIWTGDDTSFNTMLDATVPVIRGYHTLSSALAGSYFTAFRDTEDITGTATAITATVLSEEIVRGTLFVTGADMTRKALAAGQTPTVAMRTALVRASGTATRFALDGGRETLIRSTAEDKQAQGWARVTDGRPCAFCALLASRGPVYSADTADFHAHDHCGCGVEPHYRDSEWPGRGREFRDLYNQAVREARQSGDLKRGTSNDALNAFRRLLTT